MRCGACQAENPAENHFCDQCGTRLEAVCPSCGAALRPGARFCGACGRRVGEAAPAVPTPPPAARPKPAAVSPGPSAPAAYTPRHLAEKLDAEEVHRIVNRCFELITAEVHRFEGTVNQYTGDGVMALFGAPIAHEDSPR